jgi:CHAD domain-containing protein
LGQVAKEPQPKAVHQFRTISRRVETMLEALTSEPGRNQQKLIKSLAKLRKRAGRVRNIDVQTALLRGLKMEADSRSKQRVLQGLSELRSKREKRLSDALGKGSLREIRRRLRKAVEALPAGDAPASAYDPARAALQEFARFASGSAALNQETLHGYRLRTKHARYVAELAGGDERAQRVVSELKRMQDGIGEWHDWLQLTDRAEKLLANGRDVPLLSALKNVTRAKYRHALSVCEDSRKKLLEMSKAVALPPRKAGERQSEAARRATA